MIKTAPKKARFAVAMSAAMLAGTTMQVKADAPDELNIALIFASGVENAWEATLIDSLERTAEAKPHGLDISWEYTDPLWGDDAGDAMALFAETGEYDIIWAHAAYSDQVKKLQAEYPDQMFVVVGAGNEGLGDNQYWVYKRIHEPAYVLGVLAGNLTKTNTLGVVGTFPADDVNDEINAYFAGARSVNPDIVSKVAFIESWYDPGKAGEMTSAQIATGADMIFSLAGNFKPCEEAGILCFANFADDHHYSPQTILSSPLAVWDPDLNWIIDEWWAHEAEGKPFNGNTEMVWHGMAEGGAAIAPYHELADKVPAELKAEIDKLVEDINTGAFKVDIDVTTPVSTGS